MRITNHHFIRLTALLGLAVGCGRSASAPDAAALDNAARVSPETTNACTPTPPAWQGTCNINAGSDTGTAIESYYYCELTNTPVNTACPAGFGFSSNSCKADGAVWSCQQNCVEAVNCGSQSQDRITKVVTTGTNDVPCVCSCTKLTKAQACLPNSCATVPDGCGGTIKCACPTGLTCGNANNDYQCTACGQEGQLCCESPNPSCNNAWDSVCNNNICDECGNEDEPCCANSQCNEAMSCKYGMCQPAPLCLPDNAPCNDNAECCNGSCDSGVCL